AGIMRTCPAAVVTIIASSRSRGRGASHGAPAAAPGARLPRAFAWAALGPGRGAGAALLATARPAAAVRRARGPQAAAGPEAAVEARLERKRQADREEVEGVEGAKEDDAEAIEHEELGRVR